MNITRSVIRHDNSGLFRQVRQRQFSSSNLSANPVSLETSNLANGSSIQCCRRSHAASVPSDIPETKKVRKRVSKNERKSMMEAYVNSYRAMNGGKFPTASDAKKQVGGSYYTVRQILQEIEYNYKTYPGDEKEATWVMGATDEIIDLATKSEEASQTRDNDFLGEDAVKNDAISSNVSSGAWGSDTGISEDNQTSVATMVTTKVASGNGSLDVDEDIPTPTSQIDDSRTNYEGGLMEKESLIKNEEVLSKQITIDRPAPEASTSDSTLENFESKEEPPISILKDSLSDETIRIPVKDDQKKDVASQINLAGEEKESTRIKADKLENSVKEEASSENMPNFENKKLKAAEQQPTEKSERVMYEEQKEDSRTEEKPSLWKNLKSFANEIFGIWRKH